MRSITWSRSVRGSPDDPPRPAARHHTVPRAYPAVGQSAHQRRRCGGQGRALQPGGHRGAVSVAGGADRIARVPADLALPVALHDVPARRTTAAPMSSCTWIDSRTAIPSWSMIPTGDCPATNPAGSADNATPSHLPAPCRSGPYPQGIAGTHSLPCGTNRARMGCGLLTDSLPADADAGDSPLHRESLPWPTNAQNPCN